MANEKINRQAVDEEINRRIAEILEPLGSFEWVQYMGEIGYHHINCTSPKGLWVSWWDYNEVVEVPPSAPWFHAYALHSQDLLRAAPVDVTISISRCQSCLEERGVRFLVSVDDSKGNCGDAEGENLNLAIRDAFARLYGIIEPLEE